MSDGWMRKLEAELARELGQPVSIAAGGERPDPSSSVRVRLDLPEAQLTLSAARDDLAAVLVAGRVIAEDQAETASELWTGILESVAGRLGGTRSEAAGEEPGEPWTLRLADAAMRMAVRSEGTLAETKKKEAADSRPGSEGRQNFDLLLEVELSALVRFGSREVVLKDLLDLGSGDVLELDRQVNDPVDLIVGDKIVARGEVVLVDGNFGLRITEVAEPVRRLESIRCL